ncbi:unnamed protein product [Moneuplotes crassus]|uniref:RING-type domain-containing protein n=1 Tax=Euplotes crassus TaxID=5936 RepID=A0AAD1UFS6_EUPCR|nr:unnamed protein product [Moneuplotes crassus]
MAIEFVKKLQKRSKTLQGALLTSLFIFMMACWLHSQNASQPVLYEDINFLSSFYAETIKKGITLSCSDESFEDIGELITIKDGILPYGAVKYTSLNFDKITVTPDSVKTFEEESEATKHSGDIFLLESLQGDTADVSHHTHIFTSKKSDRDFYLAIGSKKGDQPIQYSAIIEFVGADIKNVGITAIRYKIFTKSTLYFCSLDNQTFFKEMSESMIVMKNGREVVLESIFSDSNSPYKSMTFSTEVKDRFMTGFFYYIAGLYFLFWFSMIQCLLFLELFDNIQKGMKLKPRIIFFVNYTMIHFWMNLIAIFLSTTFSHRDFIATITRIGSSITMLVYGVAMVTTFFQKLLDNHKLICWLMFTISLLVYVAIWIFVLYPFLVRIVILVTASYITLSFFWLITILLNFAFAVRASPLIFVCVTVSIYILFFGSNIFMPSQYFESFHFGFIFPLLVGHLVLIAVIYCQQKYGSRFMLPNRYRTRKYQAMLKTLNRAYLLQECQLCMNKLSDCELEYADAHEGFEWKDYTNMYIKTDCDHQFHPNCLFTFIKEERKCPVCEKQLPENHWND